MGYGKGFWLVAGATAFVVGAAGAERFFGVNDTPELAQAGGLTVAGVLVVASPARLAGMIVSMVMVGLLAGSLGAALITVAPQDFKAPVAAVVERASAWVREYTNAAPIPPQPVRVEAPDEPHFDAGPRETVVIGRLDRPIGRGPLSREGW